MVLVDDGAIGLEGFDHALALILEDCHRAALVIDHRVIFEKAGGILRNRIQRPAQRRESRSVDRMRMAHGDDIRVRLVNRGMQHKAGLVQGVVAFHHLAFVIGQNEVRELYAGKVDRHGIGPVKAGELRVPDRNMTRKAIVETVQRECPASGDQAFLAMLPLFQMTGEFGNPRKVQPGLSGLIDRLADLFAPNPCYRTLRTKHNVLTNCA